MRTTRPDDLRTLVQAWLAAAALLLAACATAGGSEPAPAAAAVAPAEAGADANASSAPSEDERLAAFLEACFDQHLERSPMRKGRLGIREDQDRWDDTSDRALRERFDLQREQLAALRADFDPERLSAPSLESYRLFEHELELALEGERFRLHDYPVNQMFGLHTSLPTFLVNVHRVESAADARDYVTRLETIDQPIEGLLESLYLRAQREIVPPRFVFPHVLRDCENVLSGRPFVPDAAQDGVVLADFRAKLDALEGLDPAARDELVADATRALTDVFAPAYRRLAAYLRELEAIATDDAGAWKLPDGDAFYRYELARRTGTDLTPGEVHAIGRREVARIHGEMRDLMRLLAFEGDLAAFFHHLRTGSEFYYPDDDEGRRAYLERARAYVDDMRGQLDELFLTRPRAELVVKEVEPFRVQSAGKAFYEAGAPDGTRPGIYYVNLYDMADMPIYQMQALAYHEGIPGHHMQISIAQELEGLPRFRRFGRYTAYTEGWALYCESFPAEHGFYADPYADFGRLAMELWRACRLVVDSGLHAERWTREQAIEYLVRSTPNPRGDCVKAVERYAVMPGQATAYQIGLMKIRALKAEARERLGDRFDLRGFHDAILASGPVPLTFLEQNVRRWIERVAAAAA